MRLNRLRAALAALLLLAFAPAIGRAQDVQPNLVVKDANAAIQLTCAFSHAGALIPCHFIFGMDSTGVLRGILVDTSGHPIVNVNGTVTIQGGNSIAVVTDGSGHTQPISASALPLPANAAQETGGHLASIDTSTAAGAASDATTATNTGAVATDLGAPGSAACAGDTTSCAANQQMQRLLQRMTTLIGAVGSPMQQTGGSVSLTGSLPAFAATPSFSISGTLPAFAATPTVNAAESGTWNVTNISGTISLPTGAATAANQTTIAGDITALGGGALATDAHMSTAVTDLASIITNTAGGVVSTTSPCASATTASCSLAAELQLLIQQTQAGTGTFGSALPSSGIAIGINQAGSLTALLGCNGYVTKHITSATDTLLVQGVASQTVHVCGVVYHFSGSAAQSGYLENTASANANCSSTKTQIGPLVTGNSSQPWVDGFYGPFWTGQVNTSGNGLCENTSGTGGLNVEAWFNQS